MRRRRLTATAVAGFVLAVASGAVASGAGAATTPKCLVNAVATSTCKITWTQANGFAPAATSVRSGVAVVFENDSGLAKVAVKPTSGPTHFHPFTLDQDNGTPDRYTVTMSGSGSEAIQGQGIVGGDNGSPGRNVGPPTTLTIKIAPKPAPPSSPAPHHTTSSPAPAHHSSVPQPQATSAPPAATGTTNPPPIGSVTQPPAPIPTGAPPLVASPPLPAPLDTITPKPVPVTDGAMTSLGQPVNARKYGLPGALAVVLLAGVAVGVVRLARVEFGNGHEPPHGPYDADSH